MIGIDIVYIPKIENILQSKRAAFMEKLLSPREKASFEGKIPRAQTLAGRFAAKEAIAKATGLGLAKMGLSNIEVLKKPSGQPYGLWKGRLFSLSISHEGDYALALARLEGPMPPQEYIDIFPFPQPDDHKGSRGRVAIIGGSRGMYGSVILASKASLRAGAGYSYIVAREENFEALSLLSREVIVKTFKTKPQESQFLESVDAIGIGPALGKDDIGKQRLIASLKAHKPLVIDADALGIIGDYKELLSERKNFTIFTPHEGEMANILGIDISTLHNGRMEIAKKFAQRHNCILVLKGRQSIVCQGDRVYVNETGNPGMATAGSGDVLTGIITSFLAQGLEGFEAAKLGVYLHGLSGDLAKAEMTMNGLIASDLIEYLPRAMRGFY